MAEAESDLEGGDRDVLAGRDGASIDELMSDPERAADGSAEVGQVVSREMLAGAFADFAEGIEAAEGRLAPEIPGGQPQGIHRSLEQVSAELRSGERTMRTHPAINVYARLSDVPIGGDLTKVMLALDAKVNAVDDVVDTLHLDRDLKTHLMTVVGFSELFALEHLPAEHVAEVAEIQRTYSVELAQIPIVEHRLLERIRSATSDGDRIDATTSIYAYRARDIRAFAEIPAVEAALDDRVVEQIVDDLCIFRARYLVYEDFRHIERDRQDGHVSPIVALIRGSADRDEISQTIRAVLDQFQYSGYSEGRYAGLLRSLERRPGEIDDLVAAGFQALDC